MTRIKLIQLLKLTSFAFTTYLFLLLFVSPANAACSLLTEEVRCRNICAEDCFSWLWSGELVWSDTECIGLCDNNEVSTRIRVYACDPETDPCGADGGSCFLEGTQVSTLGGEKNIEEVGIGESVISINPENGVKSSTVVESLHKTNANGYYEIAVLLANGKEKVLKVTGEHPMFVRKRLPWLSFAPPTRINSMYSRIENRFIKKLLDSVAQFTTVKQRLLRSKNNVNLFIEDSVP